MGGLMPYQLEKGPYFSVTESILDDIGMRIAALAGLRSGTNFNLMPGLDSTTLDAGGNAPDRPARYKHQNEDWYGQKFVNGAWQDQAPFDALNNSTTGYWHNWYGNPDQIMREVFMRAIEVSLGIAHDTSANAPKTAPLLLPLKTREWPIEIYWRCPAPWFEGWITWRGSGPVGHVTIHLHTPSHSNGALIESPIRGAAFKGRADYADETGGGVLESGARERGMWVIAHQNQDPVPEVVFGPIMSAIGGFWDLPTFGGSYHSHGPIVAVRTSEPDGGVLPGGRPYTPPPPPPPPPPL